MPAFGARNRLEQNPAVADLEGDVEPRPVVGQPDPIGAGNAGRAAQSREEIAQVVERLGLDEAAERLLDQGDV
jgi:hypothetical protein